MNKKDKRKEKMKQNRKSEGKNNRLSFKGSDIMEKLL